MPVPAWSYSSIKTFDQCPKKYYHLRVAKDVEDIAGEAADYGTAVHEAAELHMRDGVPIPKKFDFMEPILEPLKRLAGTRHCEMKLAVTSPETGLKPTEFFAKDVWWRGIIDLAVVNGSKAVMVDYKTGKSARYADVKQLDLMAGALFAHFPKLERIKSALLFVVSDEVVRKVHVREQQEQYMSVFNPQLDRLEGALLSGVWNPKSSPLCGWCPVKSCPHHIER
jgi:PD-(D/E)XK nuclease superfamily